MTRGPKPTTGRGRKAGGRELRTWVSAAEFDAVAQAAELGGVTRDSFVRDAVMSAAMLAHRLRGEWQRAGCPVEGGDDLVQVAKS